MLTITIPETELFNHETQKFLQIKETKLTLEHSLVSLSKWESLWEKPFLGKDERTTPETLSYIQCMILSPEDLPDYYFTSIPNTEITRVSDYIARKMTATWFNEPRTNRQSGEAITAEVIYYWLVALQIPFNPVENWHLNRLLTLVRVTNIKNDPKKKMMPKKEILDQQRDLNAERRARLETKG